MSDTGVLGGSRDCPYLGLDFYDERWHKWFFGRDVDSDRIITNLRGSRLTLLHAESGVGKSSLLRAGVAWRLRDTAERSLARRGRAGFVPVVFSSWQDDPVPQLITEIQAAIRPYVIEPPAPELPHDRLDLAITTASTAIDGTLLVMLDQFEEYFVYRTSEPTPGRLADEIARCINDPELAAHFLIAIREDSYSGLGDLFKGRIANVYGNYLDVAYLDRAAAKEAIRSPVEKVYNRQEGVESVHIEEALIDAVLDQVRVGDDPASALTIREPGGGAAADGRFATPLLQLVMETIWKQEQAEDSRHLRLATLERLEGVEHIVDTHLTDALNTLGDEERKVALDAFDHLVTPSGGKIAESVPDLATRTSHPEKQLAAVMAKLDDKRILRPVPAPPGRDPILCKRYEIFHDVLAPAINRAIASRTEERLERERNEAERERNDAVHQAQVDRRRTRIACALAAFALVMVIVAALGVAYALRQRRQAIDEKLRAQSSEGVASVQQQIGPDPRLATAIALRALALHRGPAAQSALRDAIAAVQLQRTLTLRAPVIATAYSPDGKMIAVANGEGGVELWSADGHQLLGSFGAGVNAALESMAFSADGALIATAYGDGTVRVWRVSNRRELGSVLVARGVVLTSVRFSPLDNTRLAIAGFDKMWIFDWRSEAQLRVIHNPGSYGVNDAEWSPNGNELLTASAGGRAYLWNAATGAQRPPALNHGSYLCSARFSPNGKRIVTAALDGTAKVWNAATHRHLYTLNNDRVRVNSAIFSPSGRQIATVSDSGVTSLWPADSDANEPSQTLRPSGPVSTVLTVAYAPNGRGLVSGGADGLGRVWDLASKRQAAVLRGADGVDPITSVGYSANGRWIVAGAAGGNARVWNASDGQVRVTVAAPNGGRINHVALRSDGSRFLTSDDTSTGYEWDAVTGTLTATIKGPTGPLETIAYDPADPELVLTATQYKLARLWSLRLKRPMRSLDVPGHDQLEGASFSANGALISTYGDAGVARVWGVRSGRQLRKLVEPGRFSITGAAFSRSGHRLVTASKDGISRVWLVDSGRKVGKPLTAPGNAPLTAAQFGAHNDAVVTASSDGFARLSDYRTGRRFLTLAGSAGPLNAEALSPDGDQLVTGGGDGVVRIWDARPSEQQGQGILEPRGGDEITTFFDQKGSRVVTASADGTARIWSTAKQQEIGHSFREPDSAGLRSAVFDPTGTRVLTSSVDGTARIWSVRTGTLLRTFGRVGNASLNSAVYSTDGRRIVIASDGTHYGYAAVFNSGTGRRIGRRLRVSSNQKVYSAAFSQTGRQIVTADSGGNAYVWNARPDAQHIYREIGGVPLTEPGGQPMTDASFDPSPGSSLVATSSDDGTARVWDSRTGAQRGVVVEPGRSPIYKAVLGPHGWLLTASSDGVARIWDWRTGRALTLFSVGDQVSDAQFGPGGKLVATANTTGGANIFSTVLAGPLNMVEAIARRRVPTPLTNAQVHAYLR